MNIFYLNHEPKICAQQHVDKHCVKMILETAQLLSTAHRVLDGTESIVISNNRKKRVWQLSDDRDQILYSATHINHPSAIWVRQSKANYLWLYSLFEELCSEYTYRYGKIHKCESSLLGKALGQFPKNLKGSEFTQPTTAMPDQYKVPGDAITSYRNYYNGEKQRMFSWKKRPTPEWISTHG